MSSRRDIGVRIPPPSLDAIKTSMLAACAKEIAKRELKPRHLARLYGCGARRAAEIISGSEGRGPDLGLEVAFKLVECLGATVQVSVEPVTKPLPRLAPPSMVPALTDLTSRQVAA